MLLLKANPELKNIFRKLIKTMKLSVEWTDVFAIANNNLILAGEVRSLIFSLDTKRAYTSIMELPPKGEGLAPMPSDSLLNNVMDMILYAFGKWGIISGLKVEKDYRELNALFETILRPVKVEPDFSEDSFCFYKDGIQVTYEDVMLAILKLLRSEGRLKEGQILVTSESKEEASDDISQNHSEENTPDSEKSTTETMAEDNDDYEIGLWHNLCWKKASYSFQKSSYNETGNTRSRIGYDFYISNHLCPKCDNRLYMGVYPVNKELLIDTEEGRVFMARVYTCYDCNIFYTPRPKKLLQEGDVYHLEFDEDRTAYEDYLAILGKKTERTINHNFNRFESEESGETVDPGSADPTEMHGVKTVSSNAQDIQTDLAEKTDSKDNPVRPAGIKGLKERLSKRGIKLFSRSIQAESKQQTTAQPEQTTKSIDHIGQSSPDATLTSSAQANSLPAESTQDISALARKTTEELKTILARIEYQEEASSAGGGINIADSSYIEAVKETLRNKLTAKYDARMGALQNLSHKQLSDLRNQIHKETVLSEDQKSQYIKQVDVLLYQAEKKALEQKVDSSKNKTYAEIGRIIAEVEKQDIPEELKQESLQKLVRIKEDRAAREVEHLITHIPLHLDRKQLSTYLEKLQQYEEVDITPYRDQLEKRKDLAEKEEITLLIKRGGKKDRNALWKLYQQLQEQDYKEENKAPYLEKIYEAVRKMDEARIEKICPSITSLSFTDGLKAYEQIEEGMFLPELKVNTLEMIQRRLTRLKTDESVQLMRKLKHEMEEKLTDLEHFYFYDAREEQRIAQNGQSKTAIWEDELEEKEEQKKEEYRTAMLCAINGYAAARGPYEYPLMVCDTSRTANGKEGFVLTPDHIFYHTFLHSGVVQITNIEQIQSAKKAIFNKGIHIKLFVGRKEKLPQKVKPEDWDAFAKILDDFANYLKDRPESRSLEYMAKEKHEIIHCYRCGFVYKDSPVCPKCGSKTNR
ncbi:MAG: hypothetical protein J1F41_07285 [Lachnospiraceae bacterium]|nr:hypothetical protein [Lachnospiraceae bacterium]